MTALLLAAAFALPATARAEVDAVVVRVMREQHIAGLSLGIARRGMRSYLRGYGYRDVRERAPADGFTVYRAGSVAKQFTAALVLNAAREGRLEIERPVAAYLPQVNGTVGNVPIEHLLTQTGGVTDESSAYGTSASSPGTWIYSNTNYSLLGAILERVTGAQFPDLLRRRVTQPLMLESTACRLSPYAGNVARGYAWNGSWTAVASDGDLPCSSDGLTTNAPDLLVWLEALRSGRIVSPASFAAMTTSAKLPSGIPANYGYGFFITNWFGYAVAEHPGNVPGYSALDALVLRDGLEVAVLTNAGTVDLTPLAKSVVAILDPPLDRNLSATVGTPPQNENLRVTAALRALLQTSGFMPYGTLQSLEFVERSLTATTTHDKYRATFSTGQWWADVGYDSGGAIESLSLTPVR